MIKMMIVKRLLGIILALGLLSVLAGCGEVYDFDTVSGVNNFATVSKGSSVLSSAKGETFESQGSSVASSVKDEVFESKESSSFENENLDESTSHESDEDSQTVYITPTGKRWHLKASCAGKNATATTLEKAKEKSLTPCKKCAS